MVEGVSFFKVQRFEDDSYADWVRSLPCCVCLSPSRSEAHHRIGHGRVGSVKTGDNELMPLCKACHESLHRLGWQAWESVNGLQFRYIMETQAKAFALGILTVCKKAVRDNR